MSSNFSRRRFLKYLSAAASLAKVASASVRKERRPNLVFLLADDLRFDAVGYLNARVRTPHIDRLAAEGVRFHNMFVTTSICCTSRASIFTGTYARRHGVWNFETELPDWLLIDSYPNVLRRNGYRVGFFGKYGVGDFQQVNGHDRRELGIAGIPPLARAGFDEFENIYNYYDASDVQREHHNNVRLAALAERFIESNDREVPFSLSLSFQAPHTLAHDRAEFLPEPDMLEFYSKDIFTAVATMNDADFETLPRYIQQSLARDEWVKRFGTKEVLNETFRKYYALISGMDRAIGRIRACLEKKGLMDDTFIVFTSDNGYFTGDYELGGKWFGYESSIRVPLIIRSPTRPLIQDIQSATLNIDVAPTLLSFAGLHPPVSMQGKDLSPLFLSRSAHLNWRHDFLYEHYVSGLDRENPSVELHIPSSEGVRDDRYTYLRYPRQSGENEQLFDRAADPNELRNVIHTAPRPIVERIRRRTDELIVAAH